MFRKVVPLLYVYMVVLLVMPMRGRANELGFIETFSLAEDRTGPLKQLIPGTEDYFWYYCQYYQQNGDAQKYSETLQQWVKRYGNTSRVNEMRNRQALLEYGQNPAGTIEWIKRQLGLQFNHQKQLLKPESHAPSKLDQMLISRETLTRRAFQEYSNLEGFEDSALEFLVNANLNPDQRRDFLRRLVRSDYPGIAKMVVDDLKHEYSGPFGSLSIHNRLLVPQLEECAKLMPSLLNETNFIQAYITRLQPGTDTDWRNDPEAKKAYLERLWNFVGPLAPVQNSLKAHILYHRLELDRSLGVFDKSRFMEYLKLPRSVNYMNPKYMARRENSEYVANLNANFGSNILFEPVCMDESLVRDYLREFLQDAPNEREFSEYIESNWLRRVFAETKILGGIGDMQSWYSMLSPEDVQALKERVDLDFLPVNHDVFTTAEPVLLDVAVKNVPTMITKVYEINTAAFYREKGEEISTGVDLDGLVANEESIATYTQVPLRRHVEKFTFPALNRPGVFVIEFLGNGRSSRALIRKGRLTFIERTGAAGHVFTVFDEAGNICPKARLWLSGREYTAEAGGAITVPYSTNAGSQKIVIENEGFAALHTFNHRSEDYTLTAGFHSDRESLIDGRVCKLLIRPELSLNGIPVDLGLLEEPFLTIETVDRDGITATKDVRDLKIASNAETVYEFKVPEKLVKVSFTLRAKVRNVSQGKKIDLAAATSYDLNGIDTQAKIEDIHLRHVDGHWLLELLGKTGEPRGERAVNLEFKHHQFKRVIQVQLQTTPDGRIDLGALPDIDTVNARGPENNAKTWVLTSDRRTYPGVVHAQAESHVRIPVMDLTADDPHEVCSLLELRGGVFAFDCSKNVIVRDGFLSIEKLAAGDYDLWIKKPDKHILLRLTDGKREGNALVSRDRVLRIRDARPTQIVRVDVSKVESNEDGQVTVKLANVSPLTRVHVVAARFQPGTSLFEGLGAASWPDPEEIRLGRPLSRYLSGRNIGDEYKYILERKYAPARAGNMLKRPGLLLNPWSIRKTDTGSDQVTAGDSWSNARERSMQEGAPCPEPSPSTTGGGTGSGFTCLDFLPETSLVLTNLRPDANGVVTIDTAKLGARRFLQIVAIDGFGASCREIALPEVADKFKDLRLTRGLDPQQHFTERKNVTAIVGSGPFVLNDITTSKMEVYDSLGTVYRLFGGIRQDEAMTEFSFILEWPDLKPERKRELYSRYACHELSYFLYKKDPEFFKTVVKPYLANKKDKTFLDHWLLGDDLSCYLDAWAYRRLNIVEQILLGQRIADRGSATARHVKDLYDLIPPDIEAFNHLFQTALKGSALETDDRLGLADGLKKAMAAPPPPPAKAQMMGAVGNMIAPACPAPSVHMAESDSGKMDSKSKSKRASKDMAGGRAESVRFMSKAMNAPSEAAFDDAGMAKEEAAAPVDEELMQRDSDVARRAAARPHFRKLEKTEEFVENNYYHLPIERQIGDLVTVNGFWKDFAAWDGKGPFLSTHIAEASRSFTEMMFALAVLDLPFKASKHETSFATARFEMKPANPLVVFHKEIQETAPATGAQPILISQDYFAADDRYRFENNERFDSFVTEEFQTQRIYGCQVVITNPTSSRRKIDALLQIPRGAIPVLNGFVTRGLHVVIEPYGTQKLEYSFYFPSSGRFESYPVHAAQDEKLVAFAHPFVFNVVETLTKIDKTSWAYISQYGTENQVLDFLKENNIDRLDLNLIAFRMREAGFFRKAINLLSDRFVYNDTLWSYGLYHNDLAPAREFMKHSAYAQMCGLVIESPLLTLNPVERFTYQHREYLPLVNPRAHQLGKQRKILNKQLFDQYNMLLSCLQYKRALDDADRLAVAYYMLLQDRIDEGAAFFAKVKQPDIVGSIQYDYMKAWLAFCNEKPGEARETALKYQEYPVDKWRNFFRDVLAQADEIEGRAAKVIDSEDRDQNQTRLADTEPSFDFVVENRKIAIQWANLENVRVNYYLMDLELLFSRNPFVQEVTGQFSVIRPNESVEVALVPGAGNPATAAPTASGTAANVVATRTMTMDLPEKYRDSNVMIEITASGVTHAKAYYPNSLGVQVIEKYGQVRVGEGKSGAPLARAYIKVYARMKGGEVRFYKDGYTDLRGRFDYASLSTSELDDVERFSILVLSEKHGSIVREAAPPKM
ncbi:MAG: hypothetical protein HQM09_20055 [Candidatus Riflebacteria bacterium]|nr:hypothetical protein [Candidatus Riflebacteria bacterium]